MLNPQEARKRLKEYEVPNPDLRSRLMIGRLPSNIQPLFTYHARYHYGRRTGAQQRRIDKQYEKAIRRLGSTMRINRQRIFRILFPGFWKYVSYAWDLFEYLPYQAGATRKAFRYPNNPLITNATRASWIISLFNATCRYKADIRWLAAWAPYIHWGRGRVFGILFAGVISRGDAISDEIFQILCDSASGTHPIGSMGAHVVHGLLISSREEAWQFIENLLLAAQRQEGLRQSILEAVDESHPEAFTRMINLIYDENLIRFSSVVRAVDIWFGLGFEASDKNKLKRCLEIVISHLNPEKESLDIADDEKTLASYLRLWAIAFRDAKDAIQKAEELLRSGNQAERFVGTHLLCQLNLKQANKSLLAMLDDPELTISARAFQAFQTYGAASRIGQSDLFERIERNLERYPKKKKILHPEGFPWLDIPVDRSEIAGLLVAYLGQRPPKRLIPYISMMSPIYRANVANLLAKSGGWDQTKQDIFVELLGDRSSHVRQKAIEQIKKHKISSEIIHEIESLLTRKSGDLRRGLITLILKQSDQVALSSAKRLLESRDHQQHLAGLEILRLMKEEKRKPKTCSRLTAQYAEEAQLSSVEKILVQQIDKAEEQAPTLENCLGLIRQADRTPPTPPRPRRALSTLPKNGSIIADAARKCITSLDENFHKHREEEIHIDSPAGQRQELLGNLRWLHMYRGGPRSSSKLDQFPLKDLLANWWESEGKNLLKEDPFAFYQAHALLGSMGHRHPYARSLPGWQVANTRKVFGKSITREIKYHGILISSLEWLIHAYPASKATDYLLDALEYCLNIIPKIELARQPIGNQYYHSDWRTGYSLLSWLRTFRIHRDHSLDDWKSAHHQRFWGLLRWMDEPGPKIPRHRPTLQDLFYSFEAGAASEADVIDHLIGPRRTSRYRFANFSDFSIASRKNPPHPFSDLQDFIDVVDRCRKRVCEIELGRGDMPTEASGPAIALRWSGGGDIFLQTLKSLGKSRLVRGWTYDSNNKGSVLSRILRASIPSQEDDLKSFSKKLAGANFKEKKLIEAAVYAPQWAKHIEHFLGWDGFEEGVWWIHAHTKDVRWSVDQDIRQEWIAEINSRTPLTAEDLLDGAVDVAWFDEMYNLLGPDRWQQLYQAAVYTSSGSGHTRAKLFADAMLGNLTAEEVLDRLEKKRHQDSARALGIVPLPSGSKRDHEILNRYQSLQEFLRTSKKFGSQRQDSEKLAVRIGLENLARTAGYPDPARLQWAMEADEIADLTAGPVIVSSSDYEVSLSISALGEPEIQTHRGDKSLKSVPTKIRKDPEIKTLLNRKTTIKRQASRMRTSLEEAMCRKDEFEGGELQTLLDHPVLKPMVSQLVFTNGKEIGFPVKGGKALLAYDQSTSNIKKGSIYRLAHPFDLLESGFWQAWQKDCFQNERIQPFKQIFRELYLITAQEKKDRERSYRYAGHQVNPRQSLAILGKRGWVAKPETGIQRTFHNKRITAHVVTEMGAYSPQEVEGITLNSVFFSHRGEWGPMPLAEVPPLVFSETMRDLDLVVSVAHMGGVDPETTASTIEMRTAILKETCSLVGIKNVKLKGNHALISGTISDYSVHLGSGVVHQQPGGAVCLVPVHQQHRGRIFLPFVDDDPRTAEVTAKVLMLAKDQDIKDPIILEQLTHH